MIKYDIALPLDSPERTMLHKELIHKKIFLKNIYKKWYDVFLKELKDIPKGRLLELGSGGGFLKEIIPSVICSDILPLPSNDMTFSAMEMPFENNSVSAIFMINTFHHIPDSEIFLREAGRVLTKDGKMIMIEPANSLWGKFIYKNFIYEPFNENGGWEIASEGPLSGANIALPWIVFERDKNIFLNKFSEFTAIKIEYIMPFLYLLSGGLSYRQLVPTFTFPLFHLIDKIMSSASKQFSMFMIISLQKKSL